MRIGRWKRKLYPFNPNKPKILAFRPDEQPHAKTCRCVACLAYRKLLQTLNPERFAELTKVDEPDGWKPWMRRQTAREKQFSNERYKRENLQKSSIKWRG